jgi:hypothetical protein
MSLLDTATDDHWSQNFSMAPRRLSPCGSKCDGKLRIEPEDAEAAARNLGEAAGLAAEQDGLAILFKLECRPGGWQGDDAITVADFRRAYARTRGFRLGVPRDFTVAPDGSRVVFLRAVAGR